MEKKASKYILKCFFKGGNVISTEGFSNSLDYALDEDFLKRVLPALKHYVEGDVVEFYRETVNYDHTICYRLKEYFDEETYTGTQNNSLQLNKDFINSMTKDKLNDFMKDFDHLN